MYDINVAILSTASHELTHFIKEYNPKMYSELQEFVVKNIDGFEGKSIEQRAYEKMMQYEQQGKELRFGDAVEEIVADACSQILRDSKAMEQLALENRTLFEKITDFLKELFADIKKAFKGDYLSNEAKAMQQFMDELQQIWDQALVGAVKQHETSAVMKENNDSSGFKYSFMNRKGFKQNINEFLNMSDAEAKKRKEKGQYLLINQNTPTAILNRVADAKNIPIIIRFDAAYLAARHGGALEGHYHNYDSAFPELLNQVLQEPDAIIRLNNGRLNLMGQIVTKKGNTSIVSVELNTVKDVNEKYSAYNIVVSMLPA